MIYYIIYMTINHMVDWWTQQRGFASLKIEPVGYNKTYVRDNAQIESEKWAFKSYKTHWKIPW